MLNALTTIEFSQCWLYGNGIYTGTKYAVKGIAESLRLELSPYNMRVTLVCPGYVGTGFLDDGEQRNSFHFSTSDVWVSYVPVIFQFTKENGTNIVELLQLRTARS